MFCDAVYRPGTQTPLVRLARAGVPVVAGDRMLLTRVYWRRSSGPDEPNVKAMDLAIS